MGKAIDRRGEQFGNLTILCQFANKCWVICECGNEKEYFTGGVSSGQITSCGCQSSRNHGYSETPTHCSWENMKNRCNPKNVQSNRRQIYKTISYCERWAKFKNFLEDMGERPPGTSLDRIDNAKGYSKDNCRWATHSEQNRNHSRNVWLTYKGETKVLKDWAKQLGISYQSLRGRMRKHPEDLDYIFSSKKHE